MPPSTMPASVNCARIKCASIWFRSLNTSCKNSRWERECTRESTNPWKFAPSRRKKIARIGTRNSTQTSFADSATRTPARCAKSESSAVVALQELLDPRLGVVTPSVLLADVLRNLAGADFLHESRQGLAEASTLSGNLGPTKKTISERPTQQKQIDDRDGAAAATNQFVQSQYCGVYQIGEEDGEKKQQERLAGNVEETKCQCEYQHRE